MTTDGSAFEFRAMALAKEIVDVTERRVDFRGTRPAVENAICSAMIVAYKAGQSSMGGPYPPEHARKVLEAAVELARARAACKADNIDPVSFRTDFSRFQAAMRCEHEMFVAADALLREMEKGPKP